MKKMNLSIDYSKVEVLVPDDVALVAVWSKYFLIAVAAATITVWSMMMWRFSFLLSLLTRLLR